ncbi:restriction endonuclease subunit S [Streptomyces sp. SID7909]|uniref:restriction endonuclease subunit S n=1 Tax=Streptomyces sp. SID7909 TaxID=2706092 RepID=UPI001EF1D0DB|nr:restriction endonuclease subunit S [Streptomyces sp. SID7909]
MKAASPEVSLKWVIALRSGTSCEERLVDGPFPVMGAAGVIGRTTHANTKAGSVIIGRVGTVGAVNQAHTDCWASDNTIVATAGPTVSSSFMYYLLLSAHLPDLASKTAQPLLTATAIGSRRFRIADLTEQHRISDFLDVETARIDKLAEARRHQLSLLNERFKGFVLRTIRGQDEPSPRTQSGLGWLGSVPTNWPVMPVSYQFEVLLGKMLSQESSRGPHLRPYLRNTNVQWDYIATEDLLLMNFPPEEQNRYAVRPGDLLVCEGGEPGRAAIWHGKVREIYYQKALHRVRARDYSSPRWLYYCLRAATSLNVFAAEGNATTISHLTGEQLRAHRFPFPERDTQDRLVARLDASARTHEQLKRLLQEQLALLAERRQALITAAVTGQFDVSTASGRNITDGVPTV